MPHVARLDCVAASAREAEEALTSLVSVASSGHSGNRGGAVCTVTPTETYSNGALVSGGYTMTAPWGSADLSFDGTTITGEIEVESESARTDIVARATALRQGGGHITSAKVYTHGCDDPTHESCVETLEYEE